MDWGLGQGSWEGGWVTFAAVRGAGGDDALQQVRHEEASTLDVTPDDWHACLEHGQQLACRGRAVTNTGRQSAQGRAPISTGQGTKQYRAGHQPA